MEPRERAKQITDDAFGSDEATDYYSLSADQVNELVCDLRKMIEQAIIAAVEAEREAFKLWCEAEIQECDRRLKKNLPSRQHTEGYLYAIESALRRSKGE